MHIQFILNPPKNIRDAIYNGLKSFNLAHLPEGDIQTLACIAESPDGQFLGGLTAEIFSNTLFVEFLWLDDSSRSAGVGSKLMAEVEQQAKSLGVTDLYLDTYSFQAPGFYTKLGFKEVGRYSGYPAAGIDKIFLQKKIA